jgi:hypothetical protein
MQSFMISLIAVVSQTTVTAGFFATLATTVHPGCTRAQYFYQVVLYLFDMAGTTGHRVK